MNLSVIVTFLSICAAGLVGWACTRGYYRAAYGDRYDKGYSDGQEALMRSQRRTAAAEAVWGSAALAPPGTLRRAALPGYADGRARHPWTLPEWERHVPGRPQLPAPGPDAGDPPTSEWARDLIHGIETWNAEHLGNGYLP